MRKLGTQTGAALWQHAHGIDDRQVEGPKARRSIGADVNWGVRFDDDADVDKFLRVSSALVVVYCCFVLLGK
jgi:DNA repair protein REV1